MRQLSPRARLGLFAAVLVVVAAAAIGAGRAIDPDTSSSGEEAHGGGHGGDDHAGEDAGTGEAASPGLVADRGFRLVVERTALGRGTAEPFAFHVEDADGQVVTSFDVAHDKRMHLLVARRDLTGYQHLHPEQDADGTWRTSLTLPEAGSYRVFADFTSEGERVTLGADVTVAGPFAPEALPAPAAEATTGPYTVRVDASEPGELTFEVLRDGVPVTDLEPYLGALGHLVALREGDLAFLHVHPTDEDVAAGRIAFAVEYPSAGRYRLFLQFQHAGAVQTVAVTQEVAR